MSAEGHEECVVNETRSFTLMCESCIYVEVFHKSSMTQDTSIGKGTIHLDEVRRTGRHQFLQPLTDHKGKMTGEVELELVLSDSQVLLSMPSGCAYQVTLDRSMLSFKVPGVTCLATILLAFGLC